MEIFDLTTRPDSHLFFSSYDPNDPRLGTIVKNDPSEYQNARYVLLGIPQDLGVERNHGRPGARLAPDKIRAVLYKMAHPKELGDAGFFDLGNIDTEGSLEEMHEVQLTVVKQLLEDGKLPIIIGGGNDISYPDCKAVNMVFGKIAGINIDNHFDVRQNSQRNSGTPYRMLLEEEHLLPEHFFEVGCQRPANSHIYRQYLKDKGVQIIYLDRVRELGINSVMDLVMVGFNDLPAFWGYDMDSVRASDAPGVSAITPSGLTAEDAIDVAKWAGRYHGTKLFEISEVNPEFDIDSRTTRLAALMIIHFVSNHLLYN